MPADNTYEITGWLLEYAAKHNATLVRVDNKPGATAGASAQIQLGIFTSPNKINPELELNFLGSRIITAANIKTLLKSPENHTLGLDQNSADTLVQLPELLFAKNLVVYKLSDLIVKTDTVNGHYKIHGLSADQTDKLITQLAGKLNTDKNKLLDPLQGSAESDTVGISLIIAILAVTLLLYLLFMLQILREAKQLGTHLLLGWSKTDYFSDRFNYLKHGIIPSGLIAIGTLLFSVKNMPLSAALIAQAGYALAVTVCLTALTFAAATLLVLNTKPIHALQGFNPRKTLLGLLLITYTLVTCGLYSALTFF